MTRLFFPVVGVLLAVFDESGGLFDSISGDNVGDFVVRTSWGSAILRRSSSCFFDGFSTLLSIEVYSHLKSFAVQSSQGNNPLHFCFLRLQLSQALATFFRSSGGMILCFFLLDAITGASSESILRSIRDTAQAVKCR